MDLTSYLSPKKTRKPSTLKTPAYEPEAKYVNKQVAISLAKKLRLSKIGNVNLRITNNHKSGSDVRVNVKDTRPTTRRIILDRSKGMMTAANTKNSAVGKCILGPNDYESRRLLRDADGIEELKEQKRKQFLQKKRGFAQRQLAKLQENDSLTNSKMIYHKMVKNETEGVGRNVNPHYMNALKCDKKEPVDPEIAEITRLIAGNPDPRLQNGIGFDDTESFSALDIFKYNSTKQQNATGKFVRQPVQKQPIMPPSEHKSNYSLKSNVQKSLEPNNIPRIQFSTFEETTDDRLTPNNCLDGKSDRELTESPVNQNTSLVVTPIDDRNKINGHEPGQHEKFETHGTLKHRPESRTTKTIIFQLNALKKTKEKKSQPRSISRNTIMRNRGAKEAMSILEAAKDPRFTNLASSLVPDSAKSHDLYKSMGRLSLDNEFLSQFPTTDKSQLVIPGDVANKRYGQWPTRLHTS